MKLSSVLFTLLALQNAFYTHALPQNNISPALQEKIDNFIKRIYLPLGGAQGLGLSIMQNNGELMYSTGFGAADLLHNIPNTNDTQYGVGSISKGFTALVAVKALYEAYPEMGEEVLDVPVSKLAPQMNLTFIDRYRTEEVTVRDLLSHRTCITSDVFSAAAGAVPTREETIYRQRYLEEACAFRTKSFYHNHMIMVAGEVAAAVANKTFEELAQEIYDELGMTNTAFVKETDDFESMSGRARPYYKLRNDLYPFNSEMLKRVIPINPGGGMFSTPNDMQKYLSFLMNKGVHNGRQILPAEVIAWLTIPTTTYGVPQFKKQAGDKPMSDYGYGLGWGLSTYNGWQHIQHGGFYVPYSSHASIFPALNLTIYTGIHEQPMWFLQNILHIFIFETIMENPNAEKVALELLSQSSSEDLTNFIEYPFGIKSDNGLAAKSNPADLQVVRKLKESWKRNGKFNMSAIIPGVYGSGARGDLQITVKFNEKLNETEYFIQYGKYYIGLLQVDSRYPGELYKIQLDTDAMHDFYAFGIPEVTAYVGVWTEDEVDTPTVTVFVGDEAMEFVIMQATFQLGRTLDTLPVIPWAPDSCGVSS